MASALTKGFSKPAAAATPQPPEVDYLSDIKTRINLTYRAITVYKKAFTPTLTAIDSINSDNIAKLYGLSKTYKLFQKHISFNLKIEYQTFLYTSSVSKPEYGAKTYLDLLQFNNRNVYENILKVNMKMIKFYINAAEEVANKLIQIGAIIDKEREAHTFVMQILREVKAAADAADARGVAAADEGGVAAALEEAVVGEEEGEGGVAAASGEGGREEEDAATILQRRLNKLKGSGSRKNRKSIKSRKSRRNRKTRRRN